jgi:predicted PurR-regulated permease PerM
MISNPPPGLTSPPWSGRTKRTVVLISLGLFFLLALQLLQALTTIILAGLLAYLLNPVVNLFEQQILFKIPRPGLRRGLAVLCTFVLLIMLVTWVVIIIVPPLVEQIQAFLEELPELVTSYEKELEKNLSRPIRIGDRTIIPWEEITSTGEENSDTSVQTFDLVNTIREAATALSAPVFDVATVAVGFVFNIIFTLVIMFYLMKDGGTFVHKIETVTPIEYQGDVRRLIYELGIIWNAYLRGQLLLGIIIGVETVIVATALGLPQPLVLGLVAGILEFIPNIGPILSTIPAILFALISPSTTIPGLEGVLFALVVAAAYTFIQQSEALFLVPRIMGRSLDLHPLAILIGIISGAALAGILGIILASPVLATIRLLIIYIWGKLMDVDPFTRNNIRVAEPSNDIILGSYRTPVLSSPILAEESGEIMDDYEDLI